MQLLLSGSTQKDHRLFFGEHEWKPVQRPSVKTLSMKSAEADRAFYGKVPRGRKPRAVLSKAQ